MCWKAEILLCWQRSLYSQGYGLPSKWLWDLDHKKGRTPKNWCLGTVVLVKTPESALDSREIKPVNLKGNQHWILVGRTDAEAEAPVFWPCNVAESLEKTLMLGRIEGKGEEGVRRWDGWMTSLMQWAWTWANLGRRWETGRPGVLHSLGSQRVGHDWTIEQQQNFWKSQQDCGEEATIARFSLTFYILLNSSTLKIHKAAL